MPDIQVTDTAGNPAGVAIDLKQPSSLLKYLKSELLHLAVLPDFMERKDLPLGQAAAKPIQFQAAVKHSFQLGNVQPEIDIEPSASNNRGECHGRCGSFRGRFSDCRNGPAAGGICMGRPGGIRRSGDKRDGRRLILRAGCDDNSQHAVL